ncbi:MAG: FtsH protease activity modulator HflK [Pseudomonadales bacterium]
MSESSRADERRARRRLNSLRNRRRSLGYRVNRQLSHALGSFLSTLREGVAKIRQGFARVAAALERATDRSLTAVLDALRRNRLLRFLFGAGLRRAIFILGGFAGLLLLLYDSLFMVGVTDNAVIVRLGRYDRMIDPGLAIKLPLLEKQLMVNTQLRLEENFGFRQYTPPPRPQTEREQARAEHVSDAVIEAVEANVDGRHTGVVTEELRRGPPLPKDYAASLDPPPEPPPDPEADTADVLERVEITEEALENVIPPDGKIPIPADMKMMTGDLNVVYLTWTVQYEIVDAKQYLFRAEDVTRTLRDLAIVGMRTAVGDLLTSDVLANGREAIAESALRFMQTQIDRYGLGLEIKEVIILDANPPDEVRSAYHLVNQAKQEMEHLINQAQAEYNSVIPHAKGKAERVVAEARAYALNVENRSRGEAERFRQVEAAHRLAPEVTRDRLYLETMESVYASTEVTLVDSDLRGILPVFQRGTVADPLALGSQAPGHSVTGTTEARVNEAPAQIVLPEPVEQPMHLPQSSAVRETPWAPQPPLNEEPPPRPPAPAVDSKLNEVAPPKVHGQSEGVPR